jgi:hypothetical protein
MELAAQSPGLADARVDARRLRRGRFAGAEPRRVQAPTPRPRLDIEAQPRTALNLAKVWDRHGGSVYALACALLGDEAAAVRTVTLAMVDLARSTDAESHEDTLRFLARRVYRHSQEAPVEQSDSSHLPPVMVWLSQLAQLQRACLALCVFGGHTHREAADLLGVHPNTVAELLTAGLRELGHLAAGGAATSA